MARPIPLRTDFNADTLRCLSRNASDSKQTRRLLSLALIYDGFHVLKASRHANVSVQSIRDWVLRFNAKGPDGLIDRKSTGTPPRLDAAQKMALARVIEDGPTPYLDGVARWRLCDLIHWLYVKYRGTASDSTLSRILHDMGYRKLSPRPRHHAQDLEAGETFKKTSQAEWQKCKTSDL
ncbi:MAG: winged helix-turn-helix domain-containing protein [Magnetovibrio sp.]|nr:winged helix-turn-helix domain-containing protein [Magnetovibrio sp.]